MSETIPIHNVLAQAQPGVRLIEEQPARRGRKTSLKIVLGTAVLSGLLALQRRTTVSAGLARRSRAIVLLGTGRDVTSVAREVGMSTRHVHKWARRFVDKGRAGLEDLPRPGRKPTFLPGVTLHLVKLACELPDVRGRSLSQWDCTEMARQLQAEGVVESISAQTVRRLLADRRLKPWRHHLWLSPKAPRDAAFAAAVTNLSDLYCRALLPHEVVLSVDEKTSLQPRTRKAKTLPPEPGRPSPQPGQPAVPGKPIRVEHEYERKGALNLFAAFDTRTGKIYHCTAERKRQTEFLQLMEIIDRAYDNSITAIHIVLDNLKMHKGKLVQAWLAQHPRFQFHHPPVHCSWMNQIEQWFSILQRKRFGIVNFADKQHLAERLDRFVEEWNERCHVFRWSRKSFDKVLAECEKNMAALAAPI